MACCCCCKTARVQTLPTAFLLKIYANNSLARYGSSSLGPCKWRKAKQAESGPRVQIPGWVPTKQEEGPSELVHAISQHSDEHQSWHSSNITKMSNTGQGSQPDKLNIHKNWTHFRIPIKCISHYEQQRALLTMKWNRLTHYSFNWHLYFLFASLDVFSMEKESSVVTNSTWHRIWKIFN